jgi:hypothetical protein
MKKLIIHLICLILTITFIYFAVRSNLKDNPEGKLQEINGVSNNYITYVAREGNVISYCFKRFDKNYLTTIGNVENISNNEFKGIVKPLLKEDGTLYFDMDMDRRTASFVWFYVILFAMSGFFYSVLLLLIYDVILKRIAKKFKKEKSQI